MHINSAGLDFGHDENCVHHKLIRIINIKIKIMVFSEITGFGNYCSLRPETLQMQTTYEVNKGV